MALLNKNYHHSISEANLISYRWTQAGRSLKARRDIIHGKFERLGSKVTMTVLCQRFSVWGARPFFLRPFFIDQLSPACLNQKYIKLFNVCENVRPFLNVKCGWTLSTYLKVGKSQKIFSILPHPQKTRTKSLTLNVSIYVAV